MEDEEGVRELARRFLSGSGYSVLEAGRCGAQALAVAAIWGHGFIWPLSRYGDAANGRSPRRVKQLRATRPDVKVRLMSGYAGAYRRSTPAADETVGLQTPFSILSRAEAGHARL